MNNQWRTNEKEIVTKRVEKTSEKWQLSGMVLGF